MAQLYFTDLAALRCSAIIDGVTAELPPQTIAAVEATGVTDGMPFILDDHGGYDLDLNRFFRACPTMGLRSVNSLRAYARDLVVWMRFLSERRDKKSIWLADREDVAVYHAARRRSAPVHRISAASWNRAVAALEKFYGWAVEEELIAASPFGSSTTWRRVRGGRFAPVRTVRARDAGARRGDLRFVGLDHFLSFRELGCGAASSTDVKTRHGAGATASAMSCSRNCSSRPGCDWKRPRAFLSLSDQ